jgi:peptidoglycan/xylan/chitin deacetylase (PgdA/CDA1 family)
VMFVDSAVIVIIAIAGISIVFLYIGVPFIYGRCSRMLLKRKAIKSSVLVLTFDDGPSSHLTPAVLEILDRYEAKATFFLLGRNIAGHETIVRQIMAAGHEICSHGYNHLNYWKISPFSAIQDIKLGWQSIDKATGKTASVYPFRPPYGKLNLICLLYLLLRRVPVVYWTVVCGDTWPVGKRDSRRSALLIAKAGVAVVLAHDFDRANDDTNKMVLDSVRLSLSMAKDKGMKVITLSELVGRHREG